MRALRLVLSVIQNRTGAVPRPSWCTYLVTYRCNARCQMCDSWRLRPGDELTSSQVGEVFARIGRLDVVRLTGGEPFLRGDLTDIGEAVLRASRPAVIHVTTNGSFPDRAVEFATRFSQPRRLRFMVSFDGMPQEHDRNRGQEVAFELAFETVRRLAELRPRLGLEVSANHTVISTQSLNDAPALAARLAALDVDVHSVLAYSDSAMYGAKRRGTRAEDLVSHAYPLHPALHGADVMGFIDRELERTGTMRNAGLRFAKRYYLRGLRARLALREGGLAVRDGVPSEHEAPASARPREGAPPPAAGAEHAAGLENGSGPVHTARPDNGRAPAPNPKCVALRSHIRLLPDGRVPVCQFNTETVGNLLTQSFDEVWHGAPARASRGWVDACPGCWAECEVMPSALYSGDFLLPRR